jgi:hypothetical protein
LNNTLADVVPNQRDGSIKRSQFSRKVRGLKYN